MCSSQRCVVVKVVAGAHASREDPRPGNCPSSQEAVKDIFEEADGSPYVTRLVTAYQFEDGRDFSCTTEWIMITKNNTEHPRNPPDDFDAKQELTTEEICGWMEFACWTTIVLAPLLYYVNGPSVSTDQFVVRTILVVASVLGALILRWVNWRRSKRA